MRLARQPRRLMDTMWYKMIAMMGDNGRPGTTHEFMRIDDEPEFDRNFILNKLNSIAKSHFYMNESGFLEVRRPPKPKLEK